MEFFFFSILLFSGSFQEVSWTLSFYFYSLFRSASYRTLQLKTKRGCDDLAYALQIHLGYKAQAIHGDKSQVERDWSLAEFRRPKNSSCNILVATDVAARGLDIHGVECVINFDFPSQIEDYVHRIGRCGRAGRTGTAYSFFCAATDVKDIGGFAHSLIKLLDASGQEVPHELRGLATTPSSGGGKKGKYGGGKGKGGGGGGKYGGGGGSGSYGGYAKLETHTSITQTHSNIRHRLSF